MKETLKKIGSVIVDVLIVIVFIISTVVVIASISANRTGGQPSVLGYVFSSVQTDSMQGTINKGDFVVGKLIDDNTEIKVNDIVTFYDYYNGKKMTITHRVVELYDDGKEIGYITKGDHEKYPDDILRARNTIQSVYKFRIPFLGAFIDFLKTPFGFIICLVLPLLSFIAWQAYKLISLYLKSKKLELIEEAESAKAGAAELTDEQKNAIIAEYLAKQQASEAPATLDEEVSDTQSAESETESAEPDVESDESADGVSDTETASDTSSNESEDNTENENI